jgi:acyl carrier protein
MSQQPDNLTRLQSILADQLVRDPSDILPEHNLTEDLGLDSLDEVEVIMAIEEEFSIEIPDEEAAKIKTVADILTHLPA